MYVIFLLYLQGRRVACEILSLKGKVVGFPLQVTQQMAPDVEGVIIDDTDTVAVEVMVIVLYTTKKLGFFFLNRSRICDLNG